MRHFGKVTHSLKYVNLLTGNVRPVNQNKQRVAANCYLDHLLDFSWISVFQGCLKIQQLWRRPFMLLWHWYCLSITTCRPTVCVIWHHLTLHPLKSVPHMDPVSSYSGSLFYRCHMYSHRCRIQFNSIVFC